MSLLVVMPARNELNNLPQVLAELSEIRPDLEVLVVDDGSTDESASWLESQGVLHLRLAFPLGVGGAMRAGLRYALAGGYSHVMRLDADGQHPPSAVAEVLEPVLQGRCDAACGSRYLVSQPGSTTLPRRLAQRGIAWSLSVLTRQLVTDPTSGFWAFGPEALEFLACHHPTGYPEPELHLLLHRNGLEVQEVPVEMRPRRAGQSSLTPARAVLALARALLAMVIVPLQKVVVGDPGV